MTKASCKIDCKIALRIIALLEEGHCLTKIAKLTETNPTRVMRIARRRILQGKLELVNKYPSMYRKPHRFYSTPISNSPILQPIMLPHRFGASFIQIGEPKLQYSKGGRAVEKTALYTIQFGREKASIWLHGGFMGATVNEQISNGVIQIKSIAKQAEARHSVVLNFLHLYDDIEWVDSDLDRSKATASGADIKKGEGVICAGAVHKFSDETHDGQIEFNKYKDSKIPTDHAKVREYIYSGKLADDLYALMEGMKQIKMRMDMEARK
jgi:hypothetical protein